MKKAFKNAIDKVYHGRGSFFLSKDPQIDSLELTYKMLMAIAEYNNHAQESVKGLNFVNLRQYFLTKASLAKDIKSAYFAISGLMGLVGEANNVQPFLQVSEKDSVKVGQSKSVLL